MFQDMDSDDPIEIVVWKRQTFLAIANGYMNVRKAFLNRLRHVGSQFESDVLLGLFWREPLILQMLTQARADLQRARKVSWSVSNRVTMIEIIDKFVSLWQHLMPVLHEIITDSLLLF